MVPPAISAPRLGEDWVVLTQDHRRMGGGGGKKTGGGKFWEVMPGNIWCWSRCAQAPLLE